MFLIIKKQKIKIWKYTFSSIEEDESDIENNDICSSCDETIWQDPTVSCILHIFPLGHKMLTQVPLSHVQ